MYYYIFDIKKFGKKSQVDTLKEYLAELGITGEFTYINSAQTAEDLAVLGLKKGYSTIVGVGSDDVANSISNVLIGQKEAMGLIPIGASPELEELIGVTGWKEAAESLRFRRIKDIFLGQTATGTHFLTNIYLDIKNTFEVTLEFKDYMVTAKARSLMISNFNPGVKKIGSEFLDVILESEIENKGGLISNLKNIFGSKEVKANYSIIRARSLRIFTKKPLPLLLYGKTIAKTPQLVECSDDKLRLIVSKNSPAEE